MPFYQYNPKENQTIIGIVFSKVDHKDLFFSLTLDVNHQFEEHQSRAADLLKKKPIHASPLVDGMQCYTNFEPHVERSYSLSNLILNATGIFYIN